MSEPNWETPFHCAHFIVAQLNFFHVKMWETLEKARNGYFNDFYAPLREEERNTRDRETPTKGATRIRKKVNF